MFDQSALGFGTLLCLDASLMLGRLHLAPSEPVKLDLLPYREPGLRHTSPPNGTSAGDLSDR